LLRTVVGVDDHSRTHAWYWIESQLSSVTFNLPPRTQLIRARIDSRPVDLVEQEPGSGAYRVSLAIDSPPKPALVELVYQTSAEAGWQCTPPELPTEAMILQSLWEVQVPWSQAQIGVPPNWEDDNEWHWDYYVWKRRPAKPFSRLVGWVSGSAVPLEGSDGFMEDELDSSHSYLFSRAGKPVGLKLNLASRAAVVALCSGSVLFLGFLLLFFPDRSRAIWMLMAGAGLVAATLLHPSVLLLVLQAALSGVVLSVLGLVIQRLVGRVKVAADLAAAPLGSGLARVAASGNRASADRIGSDDSTAIRIPAASTLDYGPSPLTLAPDQEAARSSSASHSG
jgi:hypothetical protein